MKTVYHECQYLGWRSTKFFLTISLRDTIDGHRLTTDLDSDHQVVRRFSRKSD